MGEAERAFMKLSNWAETNFNTKRLWLETQVSATLAMAEELLGLRQLVDLIELGRTKWKPEHLAMMAAYRGMPAPA